MLPRQLCRRAFATEATPSARIRPNLHTAVILNRSPLLTPTPTPFEKTFYAYQARIHRALRNPFPTEFYFKQGSPLETRFNIEERRRERSSFGAPFGLDSSEERVEATELMEIAMKDEVDESMPRAHEADETDFKNLNRRGQRNLYLLLETRENGKNVWRLPQGDVQKGEFLHVAAHRRLDADCGRHMDTWIVSRNPIGVYHPPKQSAEDDVVFLYKAHILAGQVRPNPDRYQDFAWLTKGEIGKRTDEHYWLGIKDMLSDF
ncbi:39S mitochondrial ribosomal protein L46-domain-containing protein [Chiua virens]|nr:39S mitochondrial ribosomal protein L46-domain-containing protein [Chiua virens]